jgi:hypothetical protein
MVSLIKDRFGGFYEVLYWGEVAWKIEGREKRMQDSRREQGGSALYMKKLEFSFTCKSVSD